jgi:hypothetical protein
MAAAQALQSGKETAKVFARIFFHFFSFSGFLCFPDLLSFARHLSLLSCYINDNGFPCFPALLKFGMML